MGGEQTGPDRGDQQLEILAGASSTTGQCDRRIYARPEMHAYALCCAPIEDLPGWRAYLTEFGEPLLELPVQAPLKYELVINLKTAKALGLDVPLFFQQRADDVIE